MENKIIIYVLGGIAGLCIGVSAGVIFAQPEAAKEVMAVTFAPVSVIAAGLLGLLKA